MKKRNGFTLVEILIVVTILAILTVMAVGVLNPSALVNKGYDAQRKKDLNRIKTAFEEYFNDNGRYPNGSLLADLINKTNCGSNIFAPYLTSWPCDPSGNPYKIIVGTNKFVIITKLENTKDDDIPANWYTRTDLSLTGFTKDEANFGVSSSNILWYDTVPLPTPTISPNCDIYNCFSNATGQCKSISLGGCSGNNCYYRSIDGNCLPECKAVDGCGL